MLLPLRKNQNKPCRAYALVYRLQVRYASSLSLHVLLPPRGTRLVAQLLFMDHAIHTIDAMLFVQQHQTGQPW